MLAAAIEACPDEVWSRPADANRTWQLAYHTLFFVHLYLQPEESDFVPWEKHQDRYVGIGSEASGSDSGEGDDTTLSKEDTFAYLARCRSEVDSRTAELDLEAESGFHWLPMNKLELQFYNIRHVMQHTGELYERLAKVAQADLPWEWVRRGAMTRSRARCRLAVGHARNAKQERGGQSAALVQCCSVRRLRELRLPVSSLGWPQHIQEHLSAGDGD
jgi:hypothetical protein